MSFVFSCSFFQAFNYSGHSVKNGQRKYKEVERESLFAFQHHTSTLFLLSGLTCAPTYRTSERDYFPRWRFCGKLPVVKYPASRVVVKDFPWQMTLTLPRLFKLCTVNLSLVMEVKEFWQMQICQDIFHNSSLNIPRIA